MKKPSRAFLLATVLISLSLPTLSSGKSSKSKAGESEAIVVNDTLIPAEELELLLAERRAGGATITPELKNALREQLISRELFVQEARKARLDKSQEFVTKARMAREELLARLYQTQYIARYQPSEAEMKATYAAIKQRAGNTEYHLRQIFVPTEDEAKTAVTKLAAGDKFDVLATGLSKDGGTREKGGDLGWLTPLQLQPYVISAVTALKKGEFTRSPLKGRDGWHVILVEDTRAYSLPSYEQMAPQLKRDLSRRAIEAHLAELRKSAAVR